VEHRRQKVIEYTPKSQMDVSLGRRRYRDRDTNDVSYTFIAVTPSTTGSIYNATLRRLHYV